MLLDKMDIKRFWLLPLATCAVAALLALSSARAQDAEPAVDEDAVAALAPAAGAAEVAANGVGEGSTVTTRVGEDGVPLVTVDLNEEPLNNAIKLFANLGGVSIYTTTNTTDTVTGTIKDADWRTALEALLSQRNLRLVERKEGSGVFTVEPVLPPEAEPWVTETFKLSFLKSDEAAEMLRNLLGLSAVGLPGDGKAPPKAPAGAGRGEGRVVSHPAGNVVIVSSTEGKLEAVRKMLAEVDVQRPQVYVEAKIVQLSGDASKRTGIDWSMLGGYHIGMGGGADELGNVYPFNRTRTTSRTRDRDSSLYRGKEDAQAWNGRGRSQFEGTWDPTTGAATAFEGGTSVSPATPGAIAVQGWSQSSGSWRGVNDIRTAVFSADALQLVLSALQTSSDASMVSNPKLIVANEEKALIDMSTKDPYVSVKRETDGTGDNARITVTTELDVIPGNNEALTYIEQAFFSYGIKLEVTPRVNNSSNITVVIEPTISNRKEYYMPAGDGFTRYPVIDSRRVQTIFSLADGKTAMIGGLTTTSDVEVVKKVPLLGSIPLIGSWLFTHTVKEKQQQETIIFVTIGIVDPSDDKAAMSVPEASTLVHNVITPEGRLVAAEQAEREQAEKLEVLERADALIRLDD